MLVVGRRPALVRAVGEEPRHKDWQVALSKEKVFCVSGHGLYLAKSGQSTDVVRMMNSPLSSFDKL